jgi:hypothetical protein
MMGSNGHIFVLNDSWDFLMAYMVLTIHMFKLDSYLRIVQSKFHMCYITRKKSIHFSLT